MITDKKYTKLSNKEKWLGLAAEIILCMNIKFTGIYLAAIFSIVFYIGWLIQYAKENTSLPDKPDYKKINEFKMYVNERIVKGDI